MSDKALSGSEKRRAPDELDRFMELYQQGDEKATIALIDAVSPMLFRFFLRDRGSQGEAADLLQETWLRVHRVRHTYRPGEHVLPWLYAIARRVGVDGYRRRQRISSREQAMDRVPEVGMGAGSAASDLPSFDSLMEALPANQREVVTMLKVTGMSLDDVARATASSVGSVKQKAHRAYRKLRQILENARINKGSLAR